MKSLLIISMALWVSVANAQYFVRTYGTPATNDVTAAGITMRSTGDHIAVGSDAAGNCIVTRVDPAGNVVFNNAYYVYNPFATISIAHDVAESNNGNIYVVGETANGIRKPFLLELDPLGNALSIREFDLGVAIGLFNTNITYSTFSNDLYITGTIDIGSIFTGATPFAIRYDPAGGIIWSTVYFPVNASGAITRCYANDAVESNYNSQGTGYELCIAGRSQQAGPFNTKCFFLLADPATGAPLPNPFYEVDVNGLSYSWLSSIDLSLRGYITGGGLQAAAVGIDDAIVMHVDQFINVNWVSQHDNTIVPGNHNVVNSVKERVNTMGNLEYYAGGFVANTGSGNMAHVLKLDAGGTLVPNGEFIYPYNNSNIQSVDFDLAGNGFIGFTSANWGALTGDEITLIKSYFNGVDGCSYKLNKVPTKIQSHSLLPGYCSNGFSFTDVLQATNWSGLSDAVICSTPFDPNGSNAKVAPKPSPLLTAGFDQGRGMLHVFLPEEQLSTHEMEMQQSITVYITLYDQVGKLVFSGIAQGQPDNVEVSIGRGMLVPGIYFLNVSANSQTYVSKILIKE